MFGIHRVNAANDEDGVCSALIILRIKWKILSTTACVALVRSLPTHTVKTVLHFNECREIPIVYDQTGRATNQETNHLQFCWVTRKLCLFCQTGEREKKSENKKKRETSKSQGRKWEGEWIRYMNKWWSLLDTIRYVARRYSTLFLVPLFSDIFSWFSYGHPV